MPPKQIPPAVPNPVAPAPAIDPGTAAAIAGITAPLTAAAKKAPLKRKSSTGTTDSKPTVKKKKTTAKAPKPGTATAKPPTTAKAADDKKKITPKLPLAATKTSPSASPKSSVSKTTTSKSTSPPTKTTTTKSKAKSTPSAPQQQTKLQKAQQTKRDIANLESIEYAFRQDSQVWCPAEPSGGWMYRTGAAGLGSKSYLKAVNGKSPAGTQQQQKPGLLFDEVALLQNALKYNNLSSDSLTPQAYSALLEQARRYALELLVDAQDYAMHASRTTVASLTPADLTLAAEMRGDISGIPSTLPSFEEMAEYASEINKKPLPPIPSDCYNGVVLPPQEEQLTFRTYDVVNGGRNVQKMLKGGDLPLTSVDVALTKRGSANLDSILAKKEKGGSSKSALTLEKKSSYCAGKGRQIAIHLKGGGDKVQSKAGGVVKPALSKGESKNKRKLTEL